MAEEKRECPRYTFSTDASNKAILLVEEDESNVEVMMLNISRNGLGLAAQKDDAAGKIRQDSLLRIVDTGKSDVFSCLKGQALIVRWVLDYEQLENLGIGCEFVDPDDHCLQQIIDELAG